MIKFLARQKLLILLSLLGGGILILFFNQDQFLYRTITRLRDFQSHAESLRLEILAYGIFAPLFFVLLQILQVLLAPIPGEASGLLGGYLFSAGPGFFYSSVGLTVGSGLAFGCGRLLGALFTERFRQTSVYKRFNKLVCRGDYLIPFVLFIIPGFPKDSLSYLLGMSGMPLPAFLFITGIGRMPGTLMLSLQGSEMYNGNYYRLAVLLLLSIAVVLPSLLFRHRLLELLHRKNSSNDSDNPKGNCDGE